MPVDHRGGEPGAARATAPPGAPDGARPTQPAGVHGWCDPALQRVREVFTGHFTAGDEVGAAVCVYLGDELVVDLWGGVADTRTGRPWQRDTPCLAFSCTKALTAACALHLWERGAYEMDAPVTTWWPEFGQAGKGKVTPAHLLSHQAGLPAFDETVSVADTADPAGLAARLAAQAPVWDPGTAHGYHALTFGWLAGEIVRRLSGLKVGEYLSAQITGPHGLDVWLGAPDDVIARAAKLTNRRLGREQDAPTAAAGAGTQPGAGAGMGSEAGAGGSAGPGARPGTGAANRATAFAAGARDPASLLWRTLYNPDVTSVPGGNNNREVLRAGWPASGALISAAGLAGFYRQLIAGRILRPATLTAALGTRASGQDRVLAIESAFGLGFMRPALTFPTPPAGRTSAFGHTGVGGSIGLADVSRGLAMAYVPNRMSDDISGALRAYRIVDAIYDSIG